jgi:DNA repair protein RadC
MVSLGLANSAEVHPREVFRQAIHENAIAILMVHNHPSGDPTPSAEDLRITRQLIAAGGVVDIRVLDHVVIGREEGGHPSFISMREQGLCNFDSV